MRQEVVVTEGVYQYRINVVDGRAAATSRVEGVRDTEIGFMTTHRARGEGWFPGPMCVLTPVQMCRVSVALRISLVGGEHVCSRKLKPGYKGLCRAW